MALVPPMIGCVCDAKSTGVASCVIRHRRRRSAIGSIYWGVLANSPQPWKRRRKRNFWHAVIVTFACAFPGHGLFAETHHSHLKDVTTVSCPLYQLNQTRRYVPWIRPSPRMCSMKKNNPQSTMRNASEERFHSVADFSPQDLCVRWAPESLVDIGRCVR